MQKKADLMLLLITIFWGTSYTFTKIAMETLGAFNVIALRFIIAFLVAGVVYYKKIMNANRQLLTYALILSTTLFIVFSTMNIGLRYTTASNGGFLIALSVVFIPIIDKLIFKINFSSRIKLSIVLATIGIALLTLNTQLRMNIGDFLLLISAVIFALHVVMTDKLTKKVDSISLGVIQLGIVAIYSSIFSFFIDGLKLPSMQETWIAILVLSILCTAVGYIVQTAAQRYTTSAHTGLIFSLEPIFSAITAYVLIGEILSIRGYIGALILILSVLNAEVDYKKIIKG
jgi:drug/metabolite transporter (DMT)-like permease